MGQLPDDNETTRKGPWTEKEDFQLVFYVHMLGDRRWDFIAKVSGLKRTGKSCRLRWVNYLNPGLKRGKLAPHEERLVLELHNKFGNRWSKIARKLPGRTDNEIKNYWRTHMRKKAQENKRTSTSGYPSPSLSHCSSSSSICTSTTNPMPMIETKERSFYDTGGVEKITTVGMIKGNKNNNNTFKSGATSEGQDGNYWMDDIWKDLDSILEDDDHHSITKPVFDPYNEIPPSSLMTWDTCLSTSWAMDGQQEFEDQNTFHQLTSSQQFSSEVVSD